MQVYAFTDNKDGYYQIEISDGDELPAWTKHLIPCDVIQPAPSNQVPQRVTMRQARLALLNAGKLQAVNTAINAMNGPEGDAAKIEWEFSSEIHRDKALVQSLAPTLGLTDAQLDQLFIQAATL